MKIKYIIVVIITLLSIVSGYFGVYKNGDARLWVSSYLAIPSQEFISNENIRELTIKLKDNQEKHIRRLFRDYHNLGYDPSNKEFYEYYPSHNKWMKTELIIDGKEYAVKIKSQGKTPFAHKFGEHISYSIKFIDEPYPFGAKRVNLITNFRLRNINFILEALAKRLELPFSNSELVVGKIHNNSDYYFIVEERIDDAFFDKRNLPWVILNKGFNGSLIYHGSDLKSVDTLSEQLISVLKKDKKITLELKKKIISDYNNFNNAIYEKKVDIFHQYIDVNYWGKINAFRRINGDLGHGFGFANFEMAYDTVQHKFYPIPHRDNYGSVLAICDKMPHQTWDSECMVIMEMDSIIQEETQRAIKHFLYTDRNSDLDLKTEIEQINSFYKKSYVFEFSGSYSPTRGYYLIQNINTLNECYGQ